MDDLFTKTEELLKSLLSIKTKPGKNNSVTPAAIKTPTIATPKLSSKLPNLSLKAPALPKAPTISAPTKPTKLPKSPEAMQEATKVPGGLPPASKKDPKKIAEQLKNPNPEKLVKPETEILKVEKNGQWSLGKSDIPEPKFKAGDHVDLNNDPGHHLEVLHSKWNPQAETHQYRLKVHSHPEGKRYGCGHDGQECGAQTNKPESVLVSKVKNDLDKSEEKQGAMHDFGRLYELSSKPGLVSAKAPLPKGEHWKRYSGIEFDKLGPLSGQHALHVDTSSGNWGLFLNGAFHSEGHEGNLPEYLRGLYRIVDKG